MAVDIDTPGVARLMADRLREHMHETGARKGKYSWRIKPSNLGGDCVAQLWYAYRWAKKSDIPAPRQRIFDVGNASEERLVRYLREAGWSVQDTDPSKAGRDFDQWNFKALDGHISAYLDAKGSHPEFTQGEEIVIEFKTMRHDKFNTLVAKQSIKLVNYAYYVQHVMYLKAENKRFGLMMVECKSTSELYFEFIRRDDETADRAMSVAHTVRDARQRPARIAESSTFRLCKTCDFQGVCHLGEPMDVNCRSCVNCVAMEGGKFRCLRFGPIPGEKEILEACDCYEAIR